MEDVLILKDLWLHLDEAQPEDVLSADYHLWLKNQKHILAIIRLTCESEIVPLITDASTGTSAWRTLAATFASKNSTNVMRLEEAFGSAKKVPTQSMSEWISCVKSLVAQLRGVGVILEDTKVANRILCGLGREYDSMKHALQARSTPLTVEIVTEHLLSWDVPVPPPAPAVSTAASDAPYWVASVSSHNNVHRGPMATAMNASTADSVSVCISCSQSLGPVRGHNPVGPVRDHNALRYDPYQRPMFCRTCGKTGHPESRCWLRFPHLHPSWLRADSTLPTPNPTYATGVNTIHSTNSNALRPFSASVTPVSRPAYSAHLAVDPLSSFPRSYSPIAPDLSPAPASPAFAHSDYTFAGPDTLPSTFHVSDVAFPTLHEAFSNHLRFRNEYCFTLEEVPHLLSLRTDALAGGCADALAVGEVFPGDTPGRWLIDSGASCHYSPFRHLFLGLHRVDPPVRILTGKGFIEAQFRGPIPLLIRANNDIHYLLLEDVLFVPDLQSCVNLFSVVMLADKGIQSTFGPDHVTFTGTDGAILAMGTRIGNSWWLDADVRSHMLCLDMQHVTPQSEDIWHLRMGHLNHADLVFLPNVSLGVSIGTPPIPTKSSACVACLVGKQHRNVSYYPRGVTSRHACLHIDITGPMQSYGYIAKHLYAAVVVDEGTRFTYVYCIKSKDELRDCIREHVALVEHQTNDKVLALFSDNEPVILQGHFQEWLRTHGIKHYTTQTYSPEMNGVAENAIKQIVSRASAMMSAAGIPLSFWPEAVRCATYLKNRSPHKALDRLTPYESYYGVKPDLSHVCVFGCRCYTHVEKENRQKLDSHSVECVFMGYYSTQRLFAVFDVTKRVMLKKRDIIFVEHVLGHPTMQQYGLAPGFDIVGLPLPVQPLDNQLSPAEQQIPPPAPNTLRENALVAAVVDNPPEVKQSPAVVNSPDVNIRDMIRGH